MSRPGQLKFLRRYFLFQLLVGFWGLSLYCMEEPWYGRNLGLWITTGKYLPTNQETHWTVKWVEIYSYYVKLLAFYNLQWLQILESTLNLARDNSRELLEFSVSLPKTEQAFTSAELCEPKDWQMIVYILFSLLRVDLSKYSCQGKTHKNQERSCLHFLPPSHPAKLYIYIK